jgi:poly(3-hydroxybutyrate) depolymerase
MLSRASSHRDGRAVRCPALFLSGSIAALAALASSSGAGFAQSGSQGVPLPALGANIESTSVSGLSAGAFMASQFHVAHSRHVVGVGIVAGGPFGCAEAATPWFARWFGLTATVYWATGRCMVGSRLGLGIPANRTLEAQVHALAQSGRIDPLPEIARARVYVFTSTADTVVKSPVVEAAETLYASLGVPRSSFAPVRRTDAKHAFVTEEKGAECGKEAPDFITDCNYDQAGAILRHIYPDVTGKTQPSATLTVFDQRPFTSGLNAHGLADAGYAYVPPQCAGAPGCRVHVVFHGCKQAGEGFVRDSGYAEWADNNRLIVLFPQVKASTDGVNPLGCWDWWGYTGSDYLTQTGPQIAAVRRMLDRLAQPRPPN